MDDFLAGFNDANTTDVASYEEEPDMDEEEEDDSYGIDFKVSGHGQPLCGSVGVSSAVRIRLGGVSFPSLN